MELATNAGTRIIEEEADVSGFLKVDVIKRCNCKYISI